MYTLVVVDMQEYFVDTNKKLVVKNCIKEVESAVKNNAHIVFLEYDGHEGTLPIFMEPVNNYHSFAVKKKCDDDGSAEVQKAVHENGFMVGRFRVIGVNTDWCVQATVRGIRKRFPNSFVEVVKDACHSNDDHARGIRMIRSIGNVDII
jgi:nicotinamidase-related amidase